MLTTGRVQIRKDINNKFTINNPLSSSYHMQISIHTLVYVLTYVCLCTCMNIHIDTNTYMHTGNVLYAYTQTCSFIHKYIQTTRIIIFLPKIVYNST